jgi:hypothetical protein
MDHRVGHKERRAIMRGKRATDAVIVEEAPLPEPAAPPDALGPAPMDEGPADTKEACASCAGTVALQEGSADTSQNHDQLDEARALNAAIAAPDEPEPDAAEPDAAEDPTVLPPTAVTAVETDNAADLPHDAPTTILPAALAANLSEAVTLQQPAIAMPRRVPRYSQPLRNNPFFLYRAPDPLRDANDPSLPPPPGLKWAYNRRQVRWYLRSAEEGPLASRPWIWALLLLAGVFALAILSRLVGG